MSAGESSGGANRRGATETANLKSSAQTEIQPGSADADLQHFLRLAAAQIRHKLKKATSSEPYSASINSMRMLEELIKEQTPNHEPVNEDPRLAARSSR